MKFRTDFADELKFNDKKEFSKQIKKYKNCKMTTINILNDKNQFNKEKGRYISIDFNNLMDKPIRSEVEKLLISALNDLYKINNKDKILIVGLGNQKILADSLGPKVADKIVVTNHLFKVLNIKENVNRVCVFTPKVMGQTGLESADLVVAVSKLFKPSLTIVIDALSSSSIHRVNKVIQLSDTGISPGSGVGNYRKEINEKNLSCKVIAIGVATVVEANKIIEEYNQKRFFSNNENYNIILTPKEIDEDIENLSTVIADSINKYIHDDFKQI